MFMTFGLGFTIAAREYDVGSASRMGPAYFPAVLGTLLTLLGAAIFARSFFVDSGRVPRFTLRQPVLILASVVLFALALEPLGLVAAVLILIVLGALAGREFKWREVGLLYGVLIAVSVLVFHVGLGLPFQLWPAFVVG